MKMHQLMRHSLSSSFWPKNQLMKWITHPLTLNLAPNDSLLFPEIKSTSKDEDFRTLKTSKNCVEGIESYSETEVPKMFRTVDGSTFGLNA
jgi:hypothetical protein